MTFLSNPSDRRYPEQSRKTDQVCNRIDNSLQRSVKIQRLETEQKIRPEDSFRSD